MLSDDGTSKYPLLASSEKGNRVQNRPTNSLTPLKSSSVNSVVVPESKPRKTWDYKSILSNPRRAPVKNKERGSRATSDILAVQELDPLTKRKSKVDRKPKKSKKESKLYPGKLYREKTFGVFSTPTTGDSENYERPSNVPRRRVQNEEMDFFDRGYVSDIKCDRPRSFVEENRSVIPERAIRPKSAGQALYAADSDDDSSLDGEIEYIDIEQDDSFFLGYEDEGYFKETPKRDSIDNKNGKYQENVGHANRFHGNQEDISKQTDQLYVSESEKYIDGIYSDNITSNQASLENTLSPTTQEQRRRIKSDSSTMSPRNNFFDRRRESEIIQRDIEKSEFIRKANSLNKKPQSYMKNETIQSDMYSDKTYAKAVEKVLTKYSNMSMSSGEKRGDLRADLGAVRPIAGQMTGKSATYGMRASMPRKLKPLLNREKIGHVNQDRTSEIDYRVPFS
ncbi:hypothetical protein SNE40_015878 [Patella caerulea]|uniref:Uncharacterized protein n=1 Tax=Patella caerulea TaxID=87958 RepID=A0AAN8PHM5_PATCE